MQARFDASSFLQIRFYANLVLDGLHIQESHLAMIGLLYADGNLAAQFVMAESPHVLGFAQPAIQFPAVLRRQLFRSRFEFGHRAHDSKIIALERRVNR